MNIENITPGYYWVKILQENDEFRWEIVDIYQHKSFHSPMLCVRYFGGGSSILALTYQFASDWERIPDRI